MSHVEYSKGLTHHFQEVQRTDLFVIIISVFNSSFTHSKEAYTQQVSQVNKSVFSMSNLPIFVQENYILGIIYGEDTFLFY
jgi:hypothetical protein